MPSDDSRLAVLEANHAALAAAVKEYHDDLREVRQALTALVEGNKRIEEKIDGGGEAHGKMDTRVRDLERWRDGLSGKLAIIGALGTIIAAALVDWFKSALKGP